LVLTFDNSKYSNKPFPEKKGETGLSGCYANANLFQEKELATYDDWTEKELIDRRGRIIAWAIERWRVEADPAPNVEVSDEEAEIDEEDPLEGEYPPSLPAVLNAWPHDKLIKYLDKIRVWSKYTYLYLKVLTHEDGPISYSEIKHKISELLGKEINKRSVAGMFAGLSRQSIKKGRERLDLECAGQYRINEKYREIIKGYIADNEPPAKETNG
jgi:hypothetical protein